MGAGCKLEGCKLEGCKLVGQGCGDLRGKGGVLVRVRIRLLACGPGEGAR